MWYGGGLSNCLGGDPMCVGLEGGSWLLVKAKGRLGTAPVALILPWARSLKVNFVYFESNFSTCKI